MPRAYENTHPNRGARARTERWKGVPVQRCACVKRAREGEEGRTTRISLFSLYCYCFLFVSCCCVGASRIAIGTCGKLQLISFLHVSVVTASSRPKRHTRERRRSREMSIQRKTEAITAERALRNCLLCASGAKVRRGA